jgi:ferritin
MNISKRMEDAINKQINAELYSSYLYLSMAGQFESQNLKGLAHWLQVQSGEENTHAMKFYKYLNERGGTVALSEIAKPKGKWKSALEAFEDTLAHEQKVTDMIYRLVDTATAEKDYATRYFLQWFVDEQVEEEANATEIVQKLKMVGDSKTGLLMLDRHLGKRGSEK